MCRGSQPELSVLWAVPSLIIDYNELTFSEPSIFESDLFAIIKDPALGNNPTPVIIEFGEGKGGEYQVTRLAEMSPWTVEITALATHKGDANNMVFVKPAKILNILRNPNTVSPGEETLLERLFTHLTTCLYGGVCGCWQTKVKKVGEILTALAYLEWSVRDWTQFIDANILWQERNLRETILAYSHGSAAGVRGQDRRQKIPIVFPRVGGDRLPSILDEIIEQKLGILEGEEKDFCDLLQSVDDLLRREGLGEVLKKLGTYPTFLDYLQHRHRKLIEEADKRGEKLEVSVHVFVPTLPRGLIMRVAQSLSIFLLSRSGNTSGPANGLRIYVDFLGTSVSCRNAAELMRELMKCNREIECFCEERAAELEVSQAVMDVQCESVSAGEGTEPTESQKIAGNLLKRLSMSERDFLILVGEVPKDILVDLASELVRREARAGDEAPASSRVLIGVPKYPPHLTVREKGLVYDLDTNLLDIYESCADGEDTVTIKDVENRKGTSRNPCGGRAGCKYQVSFVPLTLLTR